MFCDQKYLRLRNRISLIDVSARIPDAVLSSKGPLSCVLLARVGRPDDCPC